MEYTNHPSLNVWVPLLNSLLMAPSSVKCTETLASSSAILEAKSALCKEFEPLVVTLETKLDHYFNEQNAKLIKVSCLLLSIYLFVSLFLIRFKAHLSVIATCII